MTKIHNLFFRTFFIVLGIHLSAIAIAQDGSTIEMWRRGPGNYQVGQGKKLDLKVVDLAKQKKTQKKLLDMQYERSVNYEGFYLKDLLAHFPKGREDQIILHFTNKTLIPLPLRDAEKQFGQTVFIATRIKEDKIWEDSFPKSRKMHHMYLTPLPITFEKNKVVVASGAHPYTDWEAKKDFSPWQSMSTLVGIEYVVREAYEDQFITGKTTESIEGVKVFLKRCQYCHGVDGLGAQFGWNINGPIPLYKKRQPGDLFLHVKYPKYKGNYFDSGMPVQRNFTEREAEKLWMWFKEATNTKLRNYP